jgi:hypothetical protein
MIYDALVNDAGKPVPLFAVVHFLTPFELQSGAIACFEAFKTCPVIISLQGKTARNKKMKNPECPAEPSEKKRMNPDYPAEPKSGRRG